MVIAGQSARTLIPGQEMLWGPGADGDPREGLRGQGLPSWLGNALPWAIQRKPHEVGIALGLKYEHACSVDQLCPTLCDPMDCSPPGSCVHEIFVARILDWVAVSFSRGSS